MAAGDQDGDDEYHRFGSFTAGTILKSTATSWTGGVGVIMHSVNEYLEEGEPAIERYS